jgi:hypothetical protein
VQTSLQHSNAKQKRVFSLLWPKKRLGIFVLFLTVLKIKFFMKKVWMIFLVPIMALAVSCNQQPPATSNCAAVSGYEIVVAETPVNSDATKQLEIKCPGNKRAIGAGWSVEDPTSAILEGEATYFQPGYDGKSWLVNAKNKSTFAPNWKLKVMCICADICDTTKSVSTTPADSVMTK